jgi:DNA-directed RNA polymerase subunit E'/Rpb7
MESSALYVRSLLTETILLKPRELGSNFVEVVQAHLVETFEGRCSVYGFIRPHSIVVHSVTRGSVVAASLNGDVHVSVEFYASVCNPAVGDILKSRVIHVNPRVGVMTYCMDRDDVSGEELPVIECMVPSQVVVMPSEIPLEDLKEGQTVMIEVILKQFELKDPKISVIGRAVTQETLKSKIASSAARSSVPLVQPFSGLRPMSEDTDDEDEDAMDADDRDADEAEDADDRDADADADDADAEDADAEEAEDDDEDDEGEETASARGGGCHDEDVDVDVDVDVDEEEDCGDDVGVEDDA